MTNEMYISNFVVYLFRLLTILIFDPVHARIAYSIKHGFHLALTFLANAKKLEYENFFIFMISEFTHVMLKVCVKLAALSAEWPGRRKNLRT